MLTLFTGQQKISLVTLFTGQQKIRVVTLLIGQERIWQASALVGTEIMTIFVPRALFFNAFHIEKKSCNDETGRFPSAVFNADYLSGNVPLLTVHEISFSLFSRIA